VGEGEKPVSIPVRVIYDWEKIRICEDCGRKIATELLKYVRKQKYEADISKLFCDECWEWNIANGGIKSELDPRVIRK